MARAYIEADESTETSDTAGDDRSISERARTRCDLQDQVEAFLKHGGAIQKIEQHVTADPPEKPSSSYNGRSI